MDEMWADFAAKLRSGEVSAAAGSGGGLGGLLGSGRGAASWAHLLMMIAMIITLWIRRKERARKKAERLEQVPAQLLPGRVALRKLCRNESVGADRLGRWRGTRA